VIQLSLVEGELEDEFQRLKVREESSSLTPSSSKRNSDKWTPTLRAFSSKDMFSETQKQYVSKKMLDLSKFCTNLKSEMTSTESKEKRY